MALGHQAGGRKAVSADTKTLAEQPDSVRAALLHVARRRRAGPSAEAVARCEGALAELQQALRDMLPDHPTCRHAQQLAALARRITVGTTSTADLTVLDELPADALAIVGMKPGRFVVWLQNAQRQN